MTLQDIFIRNTKENYIAPELYKTYGVKAGLRNENGTGVKVGLTKICDVVGYEESKTGEKVDADGRLIFRGYELHDLVNAQKGNEEIEGFETVAFLLIFGTYPTKEELSMFKHTLLNQPPLSTLELSYRTSNLMNAIQFETLRLYGVDENPEDDTLSERMMKGIRILAYMPLIALSHYKHAPIIINPLRDKSIAENILWILNGKYTQEEAHVLDVLLMIHADHGGGNNSTFTNVVMSSTGTDIYSCISSALGSLKGPKHGGANWMVTRQFEKVWEAVGITTDHEVLKDVARRILHRDFNDNSGLIYGIGHAVYTLSDPRCEILKAESARLAVECGKKAEFDSLQAFEKAALEVMYEEKGIRTCANVDFYSGFIYSMLHIPSELFTPLFAIARCSGWVAHHLENRQSNRKLIRPANVYVGERKIYENNNCF